MSSHADVASRNAGISGLLHGGMTVAAIDPAIAHMMLMTEWQRLLRRGRACLWIGDVPAPQQYPGDEEQQQDEGCHLEPQHRAAIENLRHKENFTLQLCAPGQLPDAVGGAAGNRLDGERGTDPADRWKHGAVADPQIGDVPGAAVRVDHAAARVIAHARGAVQMTGIIRLVPDLGGVNRLKRLSHKAQRVSDQPLVVVAIGKGDAWNGKTVLVVLICQSYTVAFLRQALADDLQADLMVVLLHLLQKARTPLPALG